MIVMKELRKIYNNGKVQVEALKNTTLEIQKGEFVGIMGPSGSGKSTMLNIIGLLDSQTSGDYILNSRDTYSLSIKEKAALRNSFFGFVFQSFNILRHQTALENVMLPLKYSKIPKRKRRDKAYKAMESIGIVELADKYPDEMSGGQQQRVAIARALVNDPQVILADEPTGNLDSETGMEIIGVLRNLCNYSQKTIIVISHDARVAGMAERVIQIIDGRITEDTVLAEKKVLFENPFWNEERAL